MNEPIPSIGRIVHFYGDMDKGKLVAYAAVIAAIEENGNLTLFVMNPAGLTFERNISQGSELRNWNWPPRV